MIIQGYIERPDVSGAGADSDRGRALDGDPRPGRTTNTYYEDPEPYYQTQYKILKGRDLTRRVVRKLKLETVPEFNGTAAAADAGPDRCATLKHSADEL